jgi:cytochrome d ubiquinol oxidase subunit II
MDPAFALGAIVMASLVLYALGGGADFGGGVWDVFATGRTGGNQRELIAKAIGPIWEANHVWLILVIVLLFSCFPLAFSTIATALHIPLTIMLIGIVMRGAAFTFRTYDRHDAATQRRWSRVFAVASIITPVMFGVCVGAVLSGRIRVDRSTGVVTTDFVSEWLAPFPFALGLFVLALFAYLAAVYLTVEADTPELKRAFQIRALAAALATGALAWVCFFLARTGAPIMHSGLAGRDWSMPFHIATGAAAVAAIGALWSERYALARVLAVLQVTLVVLGWGFSQYPYLVEPDLTIHNAAAPPAVLRVILIALAIGAIVLLPSLLFLFRLFKTSRLPADNS